MLFRCGRTGSILSRIPTTTSPRNLHSLPLLVLLREKNLCASFEKVSIPRLLFPPPLQSSPKATFLGEPLPRRCWKTDEEETPVSSVICISNNGKKPKQNPTLMDRQETIVCFCCCMDDQLCGRYKIYPQPSHGFLLAVSETWNP